MVDDIERLAKLLEIQGLESETAKLINDTIREKLTAHRKQAEALAHGAAAFQAFLGQDAYNEWLNGAPPDKLDSGEKGG